ncbi:MAG: dihydropteroate synthase [Flammeovirgaceae bacterium]|nr:dihydropteroate synthase [Flammeovirgaceae bacterium]|tara:strand:+ start:4358 stop:5194 length:837 start_codon:yes stop_codon:yes gene_type:complete
MKSSLNINQLSSKRSFNINGYLFEYEKPLVMGILNMTPDSFYDGGKYNSIDSAISRIEGMINNGASIIDIGGCSTRPGSDIITIEEEWKRVGGIIKECSIRFNDTLFSVDTFRSEIARRSLEEGIHIINDVSGGSLDSEMFDVISKYNSPYILMHMKGKPKDMMSKTNYDNLILDILNYFRKKINKLNSLGINDIILDPGFGFAKDFEQNFEILNNLNSFKIFDLPILVGLSRKSFIKTKYGVDNSLKGTLDLNKIAIENGAEIIRVHDVKEHVSLIK